MKALAFLASAIIFAVNALAAEDAWITYDPAAGPGKGRHVVLLAGDEEYRSEEALPMLAKILSQRHGFKCTVCFSVDPDGAINPNAGGSLSGSQALETADAIVMSLRFRHWDDAAMERFERAYLAGTPIVALRTSTHAFNFPKGSRWSKYSFNSSGEWVKGFGRHVLGETWVAHHGAHKKEATRGIIADSAKDDPLLRGVQGIFGTTDVYTANPPPDAKILVRGQVLTGMNPADPPVTGAKNEPMQPVAWTRMHKNAAGRTNRIFCTTMGAATDLENEGLRRLVVNAVFWGIELEIPACADVTFVDPYKPLFYGFNGYRAGLHASDHALGKELPAGTKPPAKK
jgi:hypothetical protein